MFYEIYKDGELINTIVGSEEFISRYCEKNGYTYAAKSYPAPDTPLPDEEELSVWDELDAAYQEGVNAAYDN